MAEAVTVGTEAVTVGDRDCDRSAGTVAHLLVREKVDGAHRHGACQLEGQACNRM